MYICSLLGVVRRSAAARQQAESGGARFRERFDYLRTFLARRLAVCILVWVAAAGY